MKHHRDQLLLENCRVTDHSLHIISHIALEYPEKEIFLRLGGHLAKTVLMPEQEQHLRCIARKAFDQCELQGRYGIFAIDSVQDDAVILSCGEEIRSESFARKCKGLTHLWCGAVTAGKKVTGIRDSLDSVADRAVWDAVGGESADAAMDFIHRNACRELLRKGMNLSSWRYSPGFGDMTLEVQKFFYRCLRMAEMNIVLTEHCFMLPEKSVTAFAGITLLQGNFDYDSK